MDIKKIGDGLFLPGENIPGPDQQAPSPNAPSGRDVLETGEPPELFSTLDSGDAQATFTTPPFFSQPGGENFNTIGGDSMVTLTTPPFETNLAGLPTASLSENKFQIDGSGNLILSDQDLARSFQTALEQAKSNGADSFQFLLSVNLKGE